MIYLFVFPFCFCCLGVGATQSFLFLVLVFGLLFGGRGLFWWFWVSFGFWKAYGDAGPGRAQQQPNTWFLFWLLVLFVFFVALVFFLGFCVVVVALTTDPPHQADKGQNKERTNEQKNLAFQVYWGHFWGEVWQNPNQTETRDKKHQKHFPKPS